MKNRFILCAKLALVSIMALAGRTLAESEFKCMYPDVENIGKREINGRIYLIFPNFISFDREIQIGAQLAAQMDQSAKLFKDPDVNQYLDGIVQNIVRNSDAKVPFRVKLLDSDEVNAFALPGGFLYVNKGLLQATETEDQLVGVLAHEIAHVAARHATEMMTKAQILNYASIPTIFVGGVVGMMVQNGLGLAMDLKILGVSRGSEREADALGCQYAWRAGYDPEGFISFFEKMQAQEKKQPGKLASWFRTHPSTPDRLKLIRNTISQCLPPKDSYLVSSSAYDETKLRLTEFDNVALGEKKPGKGEGKKGDKPTLKRRTDTDVEGDDRESAKQGKDKDNKDKSKDKKDSSGDDNKPVLKRADG